MLLGKQIGIAGSILCCRVMLSCLLGLFLSLATPIAVEAQECSETHNIEITHIFTPGDIYIKPGECVRFVNINTIEHSAVGLEREFNSGILMPGSTATLSFDRPIIIPYTCGVHPPMVGVIVVSNEDQVFPQKSVGEVDIPSDLGDAAAGKRVFNKCKVCHLLEKDGIHRIGPNLFGVLGRTSGTVKGYEFSKAMRNAAINWNRKTLTLYLTKPRNFILGTKMAFAGLQNPEDIQDVIAYIREHMEQFDVDN
jgi:cytochrome c